MNALRRLASLAALAVSLALPASAQWDPSNGQWGKEVDRDLRVMTWNIEDGICSTNPKVEGLNNWCGLARIVAAMRPDVLVMQEVGDNSGNGTGGSGDSTLNVITTVDLFLNGGTDPFLGGAVTSWVRKYAPSYALPHVFVSSQTDGFNRNVILSRYPFADLNGDQRSTYNDMPFLFADAYNVTGTGGIRGFQHAEIDLPFPAYAGDLVIGNSHLKSGFGSSNQNERRDAARNIAYYLDYLYNGAGFGVPDPNSKISDFPAATKILPPATAIITCGDWNEDELTNGSKGPAEWIVCAAVCGGTDGTDKDGTDMIYDDARDVFTTSRTTLGGSKLDYQARQDAVAVERRSFIFNSATMPSAAWPREITGFPSPSSITSWAADHRPVVVDYFLPRGVNEDDGRVGLGGPPMRF